jgi:hypothetical protein
MPALIPTPDELARMTPQQRAKIRRYIAKVATELDQAAADLVDNRAAERQRQIRTWAETTRQQARLALAQRTPEPDHVTAARRRALLDATR